LTSEQPDPEVIAVTYGWWIASIVNDPRPKPDHATRLSLYKALIDAIEHVASKRDEQLVRTVLVRVASTPVSPNTRHL